MTFYKMIICLAMFAATFSEIAASQNLRELAREQAKRNPGEPVYLAGPPGEYRPKTIEELAREADVVLQGKLSRISSYLARSEDRILTDYSISVGDVIAGRLPTLSTPTPGPAVPLILTVYGGDVLVEGVLLSAIDVNREAITDGGQYLMFLMPSRRKEPGRYEIYYGGIFEILQDKASPLLRHADVIFKDSINARPQDLMLRIRAAAPVR